MQRNPATHGVPDEVVAVEVRRLLVDQGKGMVQSHSIRRHVPMSAMTRQVQEKWLDARCSETAHDRLTPRA